MKQTVVTSYVFNASAQTLDLSSISGFNVERLYAVINITANQVIYAVGIPAYGLASITGSVLTLAYNTTSMNNTDKLEIIYDTVNTDLANAWVTKLTDGTNIQSYTGLGEAKVSVTEALPAGSNNIGSITNVTGTVSLPTNAAQESGGHLASLDTKFSNLGQKTSAASAPVVIASDQSPVMVTLTAGSIDIGKVDQGNAGTNAQAWWTQIGDTTHGPVAVKPASTAAAAADPSLVVGLSPNSPLPAGSNNIGSVTNITGTVSLPTNAAQETGGHLASIDSKLADDGSGNLKVNLQTAVPAGSNQIGSVQQGTAAALAGAWPVEITDGTHTMPTMDVAARAGFQKITDGTNTAAVKAASIAAAAADPSLVIALSPNSPVPAGSNNIGSITNVTGTVSLPTGAATAANQTNGSQTTQINNGGNTMAVKAASTAAAAADPSAVVALSPNSPLPSGVNVIGAVTQSGTWNINNISGTVSLPTGASTSANQTTANTSLASILADLTNGTQLAQMIDAAGHAVTIKPASTAALGTDTSLVTAFSPNSPLPTGSNVVGAVTQSGTWNIATVTAVTTITNALPAGSNNIGSITNVTGTVSLPTGASTAANQSTINTSIQALQVAQGSTTAGQNGDLVQGAVTTNPPSYSTAQTSPLSLDTSGNLRTTLRASGATAVAVPDRTVQIGGSDGTNLRTLLTDTSGNLHVNGDVAAGSADSGNPVKVGGKFNSTLPAITNGQRSDLQTNAFGELATVSRNKYQRITGAGTTTVKSGAGRLHVVSVGAGGGGFSVTIYDNTAGSGTVIAAYNPTGAGTNFGVTLDAEFSTGLTIVTVGGGSEVTVTYQ